MSKDLAKILQNSGIAEGKMLEALEEIENSILQTRKEISEPQMCDNKGQIYFPKALDELDAVLEVTEEAAHQILRAAEKIEHLASWTDASTAQELSQAVTTIYEACNFQDIAGQRIAKVIHSFHDIEQKIQLMIEELGGASNLSKDYMRTALKESPSEKDSLLAGPQKKGQGRNQTEIDDIFGN